MMMSKPKVVIIPYQPTALQRRFHETLADEVLFGGAAGGGKTTAIVADAVFRCLERRGIHAYIFRRTYVELEDVLIPSARQMVPEGTGKYVAKDHSIVFTNGSEIRFRQCFKSADVYKYQGAEIHLLYIDELTHFQKQIYDYLKTRLRANTALAVSPKVRCTSNPGGVGHAWVKKRFIDCVDPFTLKEETVISETLGRQKTHTVQYIPARVLDNPHIGEDYIYELEKKPDLLRKALLGGDWNTFSGQAFPEWADTASGYADGIFSHVISPFEIPGDWKVFRSFDFGYAKPFSVLWWALDFDDTVYLVHEWYGASDADVGLKLTAQEIADGIKKRERELFSDRTITGPADPSIWDCSRGKSIAAQLDQAGVYFYPADNARLAGKMQFHYRLRFDENGRAKCYVFSTCPAFIRTFPAMTLDKQNPEDVDTHCEDHAYDAARYFLMSIPAKLKKPVLNAPVFNPLKASKQVTSGFMNL